MPPRTVVISPNVVSKPDVDKTLLFESGSTTHPLFHVDRQARHALLNSSSTIHLCDTNGPTGLIFDGSKDTIVLLSLGFLRTRTLPNFDQIAEPFSRIKTMEIPWTSTGWSETHIAFMPSMFKSLKALTIVAFDNTISHDDKLAQRWWEREFPADFQYRTEMTNRMKWIEDAFKASGRSIAIDKKLLGGIEQPPADTTNAADSEDNYSSS